MTAAQLVEFIQENAGPNTKVKIQVNQGDGFVEFDISDKVKMIEGIGEDREGETLLLTVA